MTTTTFPFAYATTDWPVLERMAEAHRRSWAMLAAPGEWWTGAQRVSIAAECRRASALVDGLPDPGPGPAALSEVALFAIHKLIGDLPNVTREWYDETISAEGMSDTHYIELLGVVVHIWSVDEFHRALDIELEPLPAPIPGEPTRIRPLGAKPHGSWPATIRPGDLGETEADIYGGAEYAANVRAAMSLHPDSVRWLSDLFDAHYLSWIEIGGEQEPFRVLTRPQRELVAARVSALNECFY
ncbi:MAG: hypothetical protein F4Y69_05695 [Chloroflexi bacterium]|nr:hypothetical protein [Chloroflexota bacterium]MXX80514.1 hypothetical protein [Chloroflexota bacterium]MYD16572.1 hypothetical protein [Chloroflexota bacterium]MYF23471.1 hypothetical protein [Chloroflexota bacterium]MYJ02056.1 hypothetical protein [Chloroflexota bacterium]